MLKTRRFLFGVLIGAGLFYGYIHWGTLWADTTGKWFGDTASGYRGDRKHQAADEALH